MVHRCLAGDDQVRVGGVREAAVASRSVPGGCRRRWAGDDQAPGAEVDVTELELVDGGVARSVDARTTTSRAAGVAAARMVAASCPAGSGTRSSSPHRGARVRTDRHPGNPRTSPLVHWAFPLIRRCPRDEPNGQGGGPADRRHAQSPGCAALATSWPGVHPPMAPVPPPVRGLQRGHRPASAPSACSRRRVARLQ